MNPDDLRWEREAEQYPELKKMGGKWAYSLRFTTPSDYCNRCGEVFFSTKLWTRERVHADNCDSRVRACALIKKGYEFLHDSTMHHFIKSKLGVEVPYIGLLVKPEYCKLCKIIQNLPTSRKIDYCNKLVEAANDENKLEMIRASLELELECMKESI